MEPNQKLFEQNLLALELHHPLLATRLRELPELQQPTLEFFLAKNRQLTADIRIGHDCFAFQSHQDPSKTAAKMRRLYHRDEINCSILLGFRLGYLTKELLAVKDQKVVVLEPFQTLFYQQLSYRDFRGLFEDENVRFLVEENLEKMLLKLEKVLCEKKVRKTTLLSNSLVEKLYPDILTEVKVFLQQRMVTIDDAILSFSKEVKGIKEEYLDQNGMMGKLEDFLNRIAETEKMRPLNETEKSFLALSNFFKHRSYKESQ